LEKNIYFFFCEKKLNVHWSELQRIFAGYFNVPPNTAEIYWEALQFILSGGKSEISTKISLENFSNALEWFGPIENDILEFFERVKKKRKK
jgi:hypothetical protein